MGSLVNLEVFSCTDNMLNTFPAGFGRMKKLHTLNVHNNNLREVPGDLWQCASLRSTNFSSNLLESLPIAPEPETPEDRGVLPAAAYSVEKVYMGDNHLTSDVFHLLALLPNVRMVNLSFNDIYEIPPFTLSRLDKLEALYLSGNKLTSLPSEDLEKLQSLKTLHLNGNRLQTLPSELGAIKSLQNLDVGSNVLKYNIANWPYDWNW
jgi:adenylate cyclase